MSNTNLLDIEPGGENTQYVLLRALQLFSPRDIRQTNLKPGMNPFGYLQRLLPNKRDNWVVR